MFGNAAMLTSIRIEAPAPSVDFFDDTDTDKMSAMIRIAMDSDNSIAVDDIGD